MFLIKVTQSLKKHGVNYAIAGGYAVNLHGVVRGTIDIDIVIEHTIKQFEGVEQALVSIGLSSKIPVSSAEVFNFKEEYIKNRNLLAWSFANNSNPAELVDVVLTKDLRDLKTVSLKVKNYSLVVLAKDSLIQMKQEANRAQDIEDIKALRKVRE